MDRTILDVHILQNVPPSNLNRDDTGTPKTALYGGVRRARVSSQAWKRATRKAFEKLLPASELGVRTKKVAEELGGRITALDGSIEGANAFALAAEVIKTATGSKVEVPKRKARKEGEDTGAEAPPESAYLMFLSRRQLDALAAIVIKGSAGGDLKALQDFLKEKNSKAAAKAAVDTRHSVDIALFGRMVADSADLNVEAATQVAHAIGVHRSEIESDYYTAVDDRNKDDGESGAGMIGAVDFNSATLYRYAAVDVDELDRNLGKGYRDSEGKNLQGQDGEGPSTPAARAVKAFLEAFAQSMPTGKINTFGNHTLPAAVIVKLRTRRAISFVDAFERPVTPGAGGEGGYLKGSCDRLAAYVPGLEEQYGVRDGDSTWVFRVGQDTAALSELGNEVTFPELLDRVERAVERALKTAEERRSGADA
ncbi:type I-E CRISPR-associated protein Cas7/Cse4/CasC [Streptomyces sp. NPDC049906]|uniref:type I-E CRISPR-associated protein Cas7/Cse4/CasC n=1 Tax=Streptomyces sp. NPDC049906 TaxID=3155656 RepID=UPI0034363D0F